MSNKNCWFSFLAVVIGINIITILMQNVDAHESEKLKLIVDADVGTDDAMGILLFLRAEKNAKLKNDPNGPELLAITCVNGNTALDMVAVNVLRVLQTVDRLDIPVYKGSSGSLLWTPVFDTFYGPNGFGMVNISQPLPSSDLIQSEHAVNALVRLVNENPGEITLVTLGPLTNVALACRLDRNFLLKLKKLMIAGPSIEGRGNTVPGVEFNFFMDPEANYIVLNGTDFADNTVMSVPWETYLKLGATVGWRKHVLGALKSPEILLMNKIEAYIKDLDDDSMWDIPDLLTAAVTLNKSLIRSVESYGMTAIIEGPTRGGVAIDYQDILKAKHKIIVALDIKLEEYQQFILDHFS